MRVCRPPLATIVELPEIEQRTEPAPAIQSEMQGTTLQATHHAMMVEHMVRQAPMPATVEQRIIKPNPTTVKVTKCWKNSCYLASMVCGAAVLPSFAFLGLGPIGLAVPGGLSLAALVLWLVGGKPTKEMEQAIERRNDSHKNFDWRGC